MKISRRLFLRVTGAALAVPTAVAFSGERGEVIEDLTDVVVPQRALRFSNLVSGCTIAVFAANTMEPLFEPQRVKGNTVEIWVDDPDVSEEVIVRVRKVGYKATQWQQNINGNAEFTHWPVKDEIYG